MHLTNLGFEVSLVSIFNMSISIRVVMIRVIFHHHHHHGQDSGQFVCAAHNLVRGEERITQVGRNEDLDEEDTRMALKMWMWTMARRLRRR